MTHSTHLSGPIDVLYVPATQCVHTPPSRPVEPALHVQAARVRLSGGELLFAGHASQASAPTAEYVSAAHTPHVALPAAPTRAECLPAAHSTQALLPDTTL